MLVGPLALVAQEPERVGGVVGSAISTSTRRPLSGVTISFTKGSRHAVTDSTGNFYLHPVSAGQHMVEARAMGFEPLEAVVIVVADSTVRVVFEFRPIPELPAVIARTAAVGVGLEAKMRGFYERKTLGFGTFLTRDDIEKRNPSDTRDLLRGLPGVRVIGRGIQMASGAMSSRRCVVQYYVDALHVADAPPDYLANFRPGDLEGLEVYRGPAETPPAFSRGGAECGVIVIWTRLPGAQREK